MSLSNLLLDHAFPVSDAIFLKWLIEDGLSFNSLCYLLPLESDLLLCLCLIGSDSCLWLLDDDMMHLALAKSVLSFTPRSGSISMEPTVSATNILCPRYRY